jgi:hypothetical protein
MRVTEDVIQQLVVATVASQDHEPVGVVVIVLGQDSLSIGGVGVTPSQEDISQAMASYVQHEQVPAILH